MSERKEILKTMLTESHETLNHVLDAVGDRWDTPIYSDGLQWTARQIVVHLADAERGHYNQLTNIAEGREVIPPDFDIERYNKRTTEKHAEKTVAQARAEIAESRKALMAWLDSLDADKLTRTGRHASLNIMSVEEILKIVARHEREHAQDIARALNIAL